MAGEQLAKITQNKNYIQTRTIGKWRKIFKQICKGEKNAKEFPVRAPPQPLGTCHQVSWGPMASRAMCKEKNMGSMKCEGEGANPRPGALLPVSPSMTEC